MGKSEASDARGYQGCRRFLLAVLFVAVLRSVIFALFNLRNWYIDRMDIAALRKRLPSALNSGELLVFDRCDRIFGGVSYAIEVNSQAVERWRRGALTSTDAQEQRWRPAWEIRWDEGPPTGLNCLSSYEIVGQPLRKHINRPGGYYRSKGRSADYIIPSLGVIVGGEDQR